MKKIIALIVAVLFVFAVASVSIAAEEKKAAPAKKEAAPAPAEKKAEPAEKKAAAKVMSVSGEVAAVDAAAKTITVKGKKADVVITVDDKTLADVDVKAGDKVKATYTSADGKNTAKSVVKKAAAKMEKMAEPEKKAEPMKAEPAKPAEKKK